MRQRKIGVVRVELQRMTGLAIRGKADSFHIATLFVDHVARRAFKPLAVDGRNVRGEMPLVIEAQRVGIARVIPPQLELRMI